jgi:hypothetical protein
MINELIDFFIKNANSKVLISLASITEMGVFNSIKDSVINKVNKSSLRKLLKDDIFRKETLKKICSDITYNQLAEKGMHNLKEVLLKVDPDDNKYSKEYIRDDYNEAKKFFDEFSKEVLSIKDGEYTSSWAHIGVKRETPGDLRVHKLYYTYNKERGELLSGVKSFKKTFLEAFKELYRAYNSNDINYMSIKVSWQI